MYLWWVSRGKLYGGHDLVTTHSKDAGKEFEAEEFRGESRQEGVGPSAGHDKE